MNTFSQFKDALKLLVQRCGELRDMGPLAFKGKPEAETKQKLIEPFLRALNYDEQAYVPEEKIKATFGPVLDWVDYGLSPSPPTTVAFLETKPLFDKDLWVRHQVQVRRYVRDYLLTLDGGRGPVRWVILTNFAELYVMNIVDREPYLRLDYHEYLDKAERLWNLLERSNFAQELILADYSESRRRNLGKDFLQDLKRWRLILANGYKHSTLDLTVSEARALSQQLVDRLILARVLETNGLQPYYSIVQLHNHWRRFTRNKERLPFYFELQRMFADLELDLNTELFKDDLRVGVEAALSARGKAAHLMVPNDFLEAVIIPDEPWSDRVRQLMKGMQLQLTYTTPYNYDFRTLTDDVVGSVYEQFLAHDLFETDGAIGIESSPQLRQREGAYYTPTPVVRYLIDQTVGRKTDPIVREALEHLQRRNYKAARATIDKLADIRVLDMACGSGAFLIEAFDVLFEAYRRYNSELAYRVTEREEGFAPLLEGGGAIEDPAERIVRENLFGIDKDAQAVEVAKVNLWLKLLKSNPQKYTRSSSGSPARLPELVDNIHAHDSLVPRGQLPHVTGASRDVVVVGNPPWGADLSDVADGLGAYTLASGQFDSYELFLERAVDLLPNGGLLGYVVPDSILHLPEHRPVRELLLTNSRLHHIVKLGEGVFEGVFRAAVALVLEKGKPEPDHRLSAAVVVKADRQELLHKDIEGWYSKTIGHVEQLHGHAIHQKRFEKNPGMAWDIYTKDADEPVRNKIKARPLKWSDIVWTGRGVELTKRGLIVQCPACQSWNNIPVRKKDGTYADKTCGNPKCNHVFAYDANVVKATIVSPSKRGPTDRPLITGENINRYRILRRIWIDTSRSRTLPRCPKCGDYESGWSDLAIGSAWHCSKCETTFAKDAVARTVALGVNYKVPSFYKAPKILVRKTGRGIYATIDYEDSYTNQVVFMFRPKDGLKGNDASYRLGYLLGVLNSKTMLYEYYKRTADIEWKSFPYLTQKTIMELPIPCIDFSDSKQRHLHDEIARLAEQVARSNVITHETDDALEGLVMDLYGLSPAERAYVRHELQEIARYGTLLGSHEEEHLE